MHAFLRIASIFVLMLAVFAPTLALFAQSRPQRPDNPKGEGKKNERPKPKTPEQIKAEEEEKKRLEEEKNATVEEGVLEVDTNIVNVDAVVFNKKTGQIITGLKKENFGVVKLVTFV